MQNVRYNVLFLFSLLLIPFLTQVSAAAPANPTEHLKPFIDRVVKQLKEPDFRKESVEYQISRIKDFASEHFDFFEMSKRVVGKKWRSMSEENRNQFSSLFAQLLGYVYIGQVDDYISKEIKFDGHRLKGKDKAAVKTLFVGGGREVTISYAMILQEGRWMAYDVIAEGVSLVRNYGEQLKAVPQDQLIPVLEKKIKKLEAGEK